MGERVFHLKGRSSEMHFQVFPPLKMGTNSVIGLTHFQVYNSIPNVDTSNNVFKYRRSADANWKMILIEIGTYELSDIEDYLQHALAEVDGVKIKANANTLKCEYICKYETDFSVDNSIGKLFGMPARIIKANELTISEKLLEIAEINTIQIEVNIVSGSYNNGVPTNTIYKCFITTPPGYRIIESPMNIIYLPVTVETIYSIGIRLIDEAYNLINFRGEEISIELHLKI